MEKLIRSSGSLQKYVATPTKSKGKANSFLYSIINELFLKDDSDKHDSAPKINLNTKDYSKLDDYQVWMLVESSMKDKLAYFNTFNNEDQHLKSIEREIAGGNKKLEIMIGKKRKRKDSCHSQEEKDGDVEEKNSNEEAEELDEEDSFNMDDFEKFQENEDEDIKEKKANQNEDMDVDEIDEEEEMYDDADDNIEGAEIKYKDAFNKPKPKKPEINDKEIEDAIFAQQHGYDNTDQIAQIEDLESNMLGKKSWELQGEVQAKHRPVGSLLETNLDFKVTARPAPIASAEVSSKIEKLIQIRVASDLFDDPKRAVIKKKESNPIELQFEKSSKGLAELYEEDFNKVVGDTKEKKTPDKIEIEEMMEDLFVMFTSLTSSTFVSERVKSEMNIIKDVKAIDIQDVSKFIKSDKGLNKEFESTIGEFNPLKAETVTKEDMTKEESKKKHRQIKRKVHKKIYQKELKRKMNSLAKELDSKFEVRLSMKQSKDKQEKSNIKSNELKSSKFFGDLQNKKIKSEKPETKLSHEPKSSVSKHKL